ncbi:O-methyltransferase [Aquabacter spiritensis]|uniref:Putative O-methyltransferase YrrM n=1 Tax=Aquabacter spiritensis TaxID=933073 RepID=A0A4R3LPT8_9HYPH|nr:O-methyltransferase [Aquabacter spiritensis]TCT02410.1 putative O-methyltransferase YrrM [Aquabacter spiritensis]
MDVWTRVDSYVAETLIDADPALEAALAASDAAGLPPIAVSPAQGRMLELFARMIGARRVLEIGTLAGYSTLWLARGLPADGRIVTLEAEPAHAAVARANFVRAGLAERIDLRIGPALDLLPGLSGDAPFDLVFIDADKPSNPDYLRWALRLTRPGSVIVADNVVREGAVADAASADPKVVGVRRYFEGLAADPRLVTTVVQTVGCKGYDGFALTRVGT